VHLVDPLDTAEFLSEYWQRRPLHLTGRAGRYAELFDMDALVEAVKWQDEAGLSIRVSGDHEGDAGGAAAHVPIHASQLADAYDRGASICVDPIDRADARVAAYAAALMRDIGHAGPVSVKCYLSPEGYGFNMHYDAHVVVQLQVEGHKRWRYSLEPGLREPLENAFLDDRGEARIIGRLPSELRDWERPALDESAFVEIVLEPGDLLCLPAGTWHEAKALERSLGLNIAFTAFSAWDLIVAAARPVLLQEEDWRRSVPAARDDGDGVPTPVRAFLADRLGEIVALLGGLDPAGEELATVWRAALGSEAPAPAAASATPRLGSPAARGAVEPAAVAAAGPLGYRPGVSCTLAISSLTSAMRWFEDVLALEVVSAIPEFGWAELATATPDVRIGLSEVAAPGVTGGAIVSLGVADVDHARRALEEAGVRFEGPTREIAGLTRLATFFDPDGNRLMLHESA
jgi:predicted enzyme related to lactoylglutathione lyase